MPTAIEYNLILLAGQATPDITFVAVNILPFQKHPLFVSKRNLFVMRKI